MTDTTETPTDATDDIGEVNEEAQPGAEGQPDQPEGDTEPETFPLAYVQKLRQENAEARVKAKRADDLAQRLHAALAAASGRLADPSDLPYEETHLDDPDALDEAITGLLARKPHLASRRPAGNVGQGATTTGDDVSLARILRNRA